MLIRGKQLTIALFTRRDRYRLGPRYHSRGIDDKGNVSNFVETEQMVYIQATGEATSHVQIRGSMPYYWRQVINLKYQPQMLIDSHMPSV